MVNFRFHLVSLTAVFLALAIGIGVGATVVDRASVDFLQQRLDDVERRRDATNRENDTLSTRVDEWNRFADQADAELVEGDIAGLPVVTVAVEGVDGALVAGLRDSLAEGGAVDQGVVWLSGRLHLDADDDLNALAEALGVPPGRPAGVRAQLIGRLAAHLATGAEPGLISALADRGLVRLDGADPVTVPVAGSKVVVVSGAEAEVPNVELAVPLVQALGAAAPSLVMAAEHLPEDVGGEPADDFVPALRDDADTRSRVATLDDLGHWRGRVAAVRGLLAMSRGAVGHWGTAEGADRILPEVPPPGP